MPFLTLGCFASFLRLMTISGVPSLPLILPSIYAVLLPTSYSNHQSLHLMGKHAQAVIAPWNLSFHFTLLSNSHSYEAAVLKDTLRKKAEDPQTRRPLTYQQCAPNLVSAKRFLFFPLVLHLTARHFKNRH